FLLPQKHRQRPEYPHHAEYQAANGTYGQRKPEDLALALHHKRDQPETGGQDSQQDRHRLARYRFYHVTVVVSYAAVVQVVDDKDGRIDRQAPQHHKGRIAPLVKIEVKERKDQEQPDKGD